jgi:hypothetical protein
MPHVSKKHPSTSTTARLESLFLELIEDTGPQTRRAIFRELFTATERTMFAKRLGLLFLISKDVPTHKIGELLKMSPSTVALFENKVTQRAYTQTYTWLKQTHIQNRFIRSFFKLLSISFTRPYKSLKPLLQSDT